MEKFSILYVDDCVELLNGVKSALEARGWRVRTSTVPVDPRPGEVVLADWCPHGPEMIKRSWDAVIFTGCPSEVSKDAVFVLTKGCPTSDIEAALMAVWITRHE